MVKEHPIRSILIKVHRILDETCVYDDIKDPSIIVLPDGTYQMYATIRTMATQAWTIGRFHAIRPDGPWQELEPPVVYGVEGPEVCAPSVVFEEIAGRWIWTMYVQTTCFRSNGIIAVAQSTDGFSFYAVPAPAMTPDQVPASLLPPVVGLYDVAVSEYTISDRQYECMVFSGYRRIGCGDLYMASREKTGIRSDWGIARLILKQEDVPFHNDPGSQNFEWGLEGAKLVQLAEETFVLIGVCFLEKGNEHRGTRQRVFLAASRQPTGPFIPMSLPLEPTLYDVGQGENGHPDTVDLGDTLGIVYQERAGEGKPWHLRYAELRKDKLIHMVDHTLDQASNQPFGTTVRKSG